VKRPCPSLRRWPDRERRRYSWPVFVVALLSLATPLDALAASLARHFGKTAYEQRLMLSAGLPAIVATLGDRADAIATLGFLRGEGHDAIALDSIAVAQSATMTAVRRFRIDPEAMVLEPSGEALRYDDILAILRATHRTEVETTRQVEVKKLSMGRAVLTGGLMLRKGAVESRVHRDGERQQVLYLFRHSGAAPWILRATEARYPPELGAATSLTGFAQTLQILRQRAPSAAYDERLMRRKVSETVAMSKSGASSSLSSSSESGIDLLAHIIALEASRGAASA
jgi:hypothetical protein